MAQFSVTSIGFIAAFAGNATVTSGVNIPAGALVVAVADESNTNLLGTMTQNSGVGGSFVLQNSAQPNGANGIGSIWTIDKTTALIPSGTVFTFTPNGAHSSCLSVYYVTGTDGGPVCVNATPSTGIGTTPSIGPITVPKDTITLAMFTANAGSAAAWTQDASYTAINALSTQVNAPGQISGYIINTGASATNSPTLSASRSWAGFILAYKPQFIFPPSLDGLSSRGNYGSGPLGF